MLMGLDQRDLAAWMGEWLADVWKLDRRVWQDRITIQEETAQLECLIDDLSAHLIQWDLITRDLMAMYARLKRYRMARGMVDADVALDDWVAAGMLVFRSYVARRLGSS